VLRDLHIQNLAVVEDASIEFGLGFNVVSGGTGAGKSIVVDSMALLAGGRARTDLIRTGADLLTVTGVFEPVEGPAAMVLAEAGVDLADAELVVRREISREGRNRIFVNDRPVTLRLLSELAPFVLRIHTQREELGLVSPELQRFWLDRSGGSAAAELLTEVGDRFNSWKSLEQRAQRLAGNERLRLERVDLLRFQLSEIESADLEAGEEEELGRRRAQLRHREAIQRSLGGSLELLFEGESSAHEALIRSRALLEEIGDWEPEATEWLRELEEARIRIDEVSRSLQNGLSGAPSDPAELDAMESRLALIDRLGRKYGSGSKEILAHRDRVAAELDELEGSEADREALTVELAAALEDYGEAAGRLSRERHAWGAELVDSIHRELADLAMDQAVLEVDLEHVRREGSPLLVEGKPVDFSVEGFDRVTFLLQANPGEQKGPVARVASGGELSRIYLALQLANQGNGESSPPTLIFDEVDAGVGGSEAAALGRKLRRLAGDGQILAVTHLPQVASCGHRHFQVSKRVDDERTRAVIEVLDADSRLEEVARMLSGEDVTETSLAHAAVLVETAEAGG
jgi:DNA repair protein RecN (Recombination protein N)